MPHGKCDMKAGDMVRFIKKEDWMDSWGSFSMFTGYWFRIVNMLSMRRAEVKVLGGPIQAAQPGRVFYVSIDSLARGRPCPMELNSLEKRGRVNNTINDIPF